MLSKCNIATDLIISHKINILNEKEQWTDCLFHVIFNSIICETYARLCLACDIIHILHERNGFSSATQLCEAFPIVMRKASDQSSSCQN